MSTNVSKLYEMAMSITQIDLGVTIRRAYDTFCEQVVSVLIEWLLDLTKCCVGTDALVIKEIIAVELLSPRRKEMGYPSTLGRPFTLMTQVLQGLRLSSSIIQDYGGNLGCT